MHPFKRRSIQQMGMRLRAAREARYLSQSQLAARIYKSKQAVSAYECGRAELTATSLAAIATALNCNVNWIVRGYDCLDASETRAAHADLASDAADHATTQQSSLKGLLDNAG